MTSEGHALPGLPNYGISQGSLFVAFGRNLGPRGFNPVTSFPLDNRLNRISMKVRVGGTDVDCIPMNSYGANPSLATQVVGLLPSQTPIGTGTFILTYNGQASAPASAGQFSIPAYVLSALPMSESQGGFPTGVLMLGTSTQPVKFTATGLDSPTFSASYSTGKTLSYQ